MSQILIMRHADAKSIKNFNSDEERPLSKKGWAELAEVKTHVEKMLRDVSLVLCSSSVRTRETLKGIDDSLPPSAEIQYLRSLYHASAEGILEEVNLYIQDYSAILIIAHNPGVTEFLQNVTQKDFIGGYGEASLTMPTASIAVYNHQNTKSSDLNFQDLEIECIFKP